MGFQFHEKVGVDDSLSLCKATRSSNTYGRTVKANDLFNKNRLLQRIKIEKKASRRKFLIKQDKFSKYFSISLRTLFENSVSYSDRSLIPSDALGIYRYRDINDDLIYIGMGKIKDRLKIPDRKVWGINRIEYSVLGSEEDCEKWESYYIDEHKYEFGILPSHNRIKGKSSTEEQ